MEKGKETETGSVLPHMHAERKGEERLRVRKDRDIYSYLVREDGRKGERGERRISIATWSERMEGKERRGREGYL